MNKELRVKKNRLKHCPPIKKKTSGGMGIGWDTIPTEVYRQRVEEHLNRDLFATFNGTQAAVTEIQNAPPTRTREGPQWEVRDTWEPVPATYVAEDTVIQDVPINITRTYECRWCGMTVQNDQGMRMHICPR
jgi:hypothetical protein